MAWNGGASAEAPFVFHEALRWGLSGGAVVTVQLTPDASGSDWRVQMGAQHRTYPRQHPLAPHRPGTAGLVLEAEGFSLNLRYPVLDWVETYALHWVSAPTRGCAWQLQGFRHEQRHAETGVLRSGVVVDYRSGWAQFLAIEGQPATAVRRPVRVLPPAPCVETMPDLFDFSPRLDTPKVHR